MGRGVRLGGTEGGLRSSFGWNGGATFGTEKCLGCICYGSWLVMVLVFGIIGFGILVLVFGILVLLWRGRRKKITLSLDSSFRDRDRDRRRRRRSEKERKRDRKSLVRNRQLIEVI